MMSEFAFQIGDRIIHRSHGPGKITGIEEKKLANKRSMYYVVETSEATLWVSLESTERTIRLPLSRPEFQAHLRRLCGPPNLLPENHRERQGHLAERMKHIALMEACEVICDLTARSQGTLLNKNDRDVMEAARNMVLNEWEIVHGVTRDAARSAFEQILECHHPSHS